MLKKKEINFFLKTSRIYFSVITVAVTRTMDRLENSHGNTKKRGWILYRGTKLISSLVFLWNPKSIWTVEPPQWSKNFMFYYRDLQSMENKCGQNFKLQNCPQHFAFLHWDLDLYSKLLIRHKLQHLFNFPYFILSNENGFLLCRNKKTILCIFCKIFILAVAKISIFRQ